MVHHLYCLLLIVLHLLVVVHYDNIVTTSGQCSVGTYSGLQYSLNTVIVCHFILLYGIVLNLLVFVCYGIIVTT